MERFWRKVYFDTSQRGCWIWIACRTSDGYGSFFSRGRMVGAHRWAWEDEHGPIPKGLCVLHRCDVPACVRPDHLFLGTQVENIADMFAKGRQQRSRGERCGNSKLARIQVREILRRRAAGETQSELARHFGTCQANISLIVRRLTWAHVEEI